MILPRRVLLGGLLLFCSRLAVARGLQELPIDEIMVRVGVHQDEALEARRHYIYTQHAKVSSRKGSTVMCEEITDYRITPTADGFEDELLKLDGRMMQSRKYVYYTALPPVKEGEQVPPDSDYVAADISDEGDRNMVEQMRAGLLHNKSKDGVDKRLFPLNSKAQPDYVFQLQGRERLNGRNVFHVVFEPKDKNDFGWKGDAFIDTEEFQPVMVSTGMARKVPFVHRTLLGTDFPGAGFNITYAPQQDGVWFPVSFGTEFQLEVLFLFRRQIIVSAQNRDFQKTHVDARILAEPAPDPPEPH